MVSDIFAMPSNRKKKAKKYEKCICKKYFFKNQRCKYNHCLVNLQYTPPPLHIPKEWNILFRFLELLPTALGCCVVCELLLSVIIELICGHRTTRYCLFVCLLVFFSYFARSCSRNGMSLCMFTELVMWLLNNLPSLDWSKKLNFYDV